MKIDGVVFDLDHTLFDRYESIKLCTPEIYEKFKCLFHPEYTLEKFTELFIETDKLKIHYGWDAVFDRYIEKGLILPGIDFPRKEFLSSIFEVYKKFSVKYPFAKDVLKKLKNMNLKTGLITNGSSEVQRAKIFNLDLDDCFDEIFISGEVGIEKPNPEIFTKMSDKLAILPERLLYVGDHPINDATASKQAGYIPVLVMTMGFDTMPCAKNFDLRINSVKELIDLINIKFI